MKKVLVMICMLMFASFISISPIDLNSFRKDTIHVSIQGEVEQEGMLELPLYSSIQDALDKAIVKESADISTLNMQTILKDKDVIVVPSIQEDSISKISINSASLEELCSLEGIGQSTAEKIIAYRTEIGLFQTLEDLMEVKGIGTSKFEKIKDRITL